MLRPKAIGLALDLRWASTRRPMGLTEWTRCVIDRVMRELLLRFFSSFNEVTDEASAPVDFERIEHGRRLLRKVIVPVLIIGFSSLPLRDVVWICEIIFSVVLSLDEPRCGGAGGEGGTKADWARGKAPKRSMGRDTLVIG